MTINHHNIDMVFSDETRHDPKFEGSRRAITKAARDFGLAILENTVQNPRQQAALRYVDIAACIAREALGEQGDGG